MHIDKCKAIQSKLENEDCFLILSNPEYHIAGDTFFPYHQHPDFYYLTGVNESDSALYIDKSKISLFVKPVDPVKELWDGKMLGTEGAKKLGFTESYPIDSLIESVSNWIKTKKSIYTNYYRKPEWDETLRKLIQKGPSRNHEYFLSIKDAQILTHELRNIKNNEKEIESWRYICDITAKAYRDLLPVLSSMKHEGEVEGYFYNYLKKEKLNNFSYGPICAADANACVLHYRENCQDIKNFILLDVGFHKNYFNSDITRTYPHKKKFNSFQEDIYNVVLEANKFIITNTEVEKDTLLTLKSRTTDFFEEKLKKFKLKHSVSEYFPHGLGHSLGHEVHDVFPREKPLSEGSMITVEPGLYFRFPDDPEEIRGFGCRIEDNLILSKSGHQNLTSAAPKELSEIYKLMGL